MRVYLDNAATTALDPLVLEEMLPFMSDHFGNPSSIHGHGRPVRSAIEQARKKIAQFINAAPAQVFFTSGGTEADNMALSGAVHHLGVKRIITCALEHHAVLHSAEYLHRQFNVELVLLPHNKKGEPDLQALENLLRQPIRTLVSLMHANNEIATMISLTEIGLLCKKYGAYFHSDTVQTMGHYPLDVKSTPVDFIVGSAHKFHGPKGVGFIYVSPEAQIPAFIQGGSQERNMRGGTENVYGIVGMAKALDLCQQDMEAHMKHIKTLKQHMINILKQGIDDVQFNGNSDDVDQSLYTVLSVSLPPNEINEMLLFNLDISEISASGGSACTSGSNVGSHVIRALKADPERSVVRFSFCRNTRLEDVEYAANTLCQLYSKESTQHH